jgi:FAD:protein FMN transferase
MQHIEFRAMNSAVTAHVASDSAAASQALAQVPTWFAGWEQCFSRFLASSELSQLNAIHSGKWIHIGDALWEVLQTATWATEWSDGLVSPLMGAALEAIGYDRSFETVRSSSNQHIALLEAEPAGCAIELDRRMQAVRLPPEAKLDLGGIAKGWAAHKAMEQLKAFGPALVDAGGDLAMSAQPDGATWPIEIEHPSGAAPELLCVASGGVATSGKDYRRWRTARGWQHHLIDVRTHQPANTDVMSATVIAPNVMMAEVAAKTALILGSVDGLTWLERHNELAGLLVRDDGRVLHSSRLGGFLWR